MEIKVLATTGRARGEAVQIRAAKFFIGRHENCQLKPDIPDLAGIHALIEQRGGGLHLRDFGAEGGTGINDRVLHARETEVFDGDLIQIGPMVLTLSVKPRPDGARSHHPSPDGWPYLCDETEVPAPRARFAEPVIRPAPFLDQLPEARAAQSVPVATLSVATVEPPPARPARPAMPLPLTMPHRVGHQTAIACEMVDGVMVVKILPVELNEEASVSPVRYELRNLLEGDVPGRMILDLGKTKYLSSRAVGVLLAHYQALERQGGALRVSGVSKEIKPVLDQMRLSMLIDIYPTIAEAVEDPWE